MKVNKKYLILICLVLALQFGMCFSIELVSETPIDDFDAKFIRVEHNTAMLFEPDTSRDSMVAVLMDCSDPYLPEYSGEYQLPYYLYCSNCDFQPLDTNDSLIAVFSGENSIDFFKHNRDTITFLIAFNRPEIRYFLYYLEFYDTFLVVYQGWSSVICLYNIRDLTDITKADSMQASIVDVSFKANNGYFCHSPGTNTYVYSLATEHFCELLGGFECGSDWNFVNLEIANNWVFAEGRSKAFIDGDSLIFYNWGPEPGVKEYFNASFEVWENFMIKAASRYYPMAIDIAAIEWTPYVTWIWIESVKGDIFEIEDTLLYTFGQDTLRIYNLNSLLAIKENSPKPTEFNLAVYPNPFNSSTTIQFILHQGSYVEASIYNLLGEKVCELVDDKLPTGNHTLQWNPENSTSGIYFCIIKIGNQREMKKMLFMR